MLPKVINAVPKLNFILEIQFDNKIWKQFSVEPYLEYTVFKPLKEYNFFKKVKVKYDTVVWGNEEEIDFDPYTLWTESVEIQS